jgi:hypothetical protein
MVVLPAPEGAENIMSFPCINQVKSKKAKVKSKKSDL